MYLHCPFHIPYMSVYRAVGLADPDGRTYELIYTSAFDVENLYV